MATASNRNARSTERTIIASAAMMVRNGFDWAEINTSLADKFPWLTTDEVIAYRQLGEQALARGQRLQEQLGSKLEASAEALGEGKLPGGRMDYAQLDEEPTSVRPRRATVSGDVYITVEIIRDNYAEYRTVVRNFPRGMSDIELHSSILDLLAEWSRDYGFDLGNMTFTIDFIVQ